ncbi:MAG: hypothetical protein K9I71_06495 [Ignavibacteriales bacterium]|nr:hypothetical protein [Ignavibacteriales bacterium]MCF8315752.1 hypothetical protein [Ignavibacteriales bacterium]MCF8437054.1 hypothetical protein [Ignavibacteriales bacterium]
MKNITFWIEYAFNLLLIPLSIILFASSMVVIIMNKYTDLGLQIKDIVLIMIGATALPPVFFSFNEKRRSIRSEYIDRLVYKWHNEIKEISRNPISIFCTTVNDYNNYSQNDPKRIIIDNQFQLIIDLISLIYADCLRPDIPMNRKELISVWKESFKKTIFVHELAIILWNKRENTIDKKTQNFIEDILQLKSPKNKKSSKYKCNKCKDLGIIAVYSRGFHGLIMPTVKTIPCPFCSAKINENNSND